MGFITWMGRRNMAAYHRSKTVVIHVRLRSFLRRGGKRWRWLQQEAPISGDVFESRGRGVRQRDRWVDGFESGAALEQGVAGQAVESGGEANPSATELIVGVCRKRAGYCAAPDRDLGDVEVGHPVGGQQGGVAPLDLVAHSWVGEVEDLAVAIDPAGSEHVLASPVGRDFLGRQVGSGLLAECLEIAGHLIGVAT